MTDCPIIFRAEMVRALLDGRKTQHREILKPQPPEWVTRMTHEGRCGWIGSGDGHGTLMHVPYAVNDRLWVREAFITGFDIDDEFGRPVGDRKAWYRATDRGLTWYDPDTETTLDNPPWKSSTQMPRWASRLTLIVTDVRIQRLQEISEADAQAEGVCSTLTRFPDGGSIGHPASWHFEQLWGQIHGPGAWDENPWVAALTFTTHRQNIDQMEPTNGN